MINCYVIGEISTVEVLCDYINSYPLTELKGFIFKAPEHFSPLFSIKPDVVFVDSALQETYGSWLARIRQFALIIIVSDNPLKAFEAFENLAFDYLLKPLPFERFVKSINKYNHFSEIAGIQSTAVKQKIKSSFFIKADSKGLKEILIKCDKLIYVEALQNYVILHMDDGIKYTCYNSMKEMEDGLPDAEFTRVHKSYIINDSKIVSIEGNLISLCTAEKNKIIIGNAYKKAFLDKKNKLMIRKEKQPISLFTPPKIALSIWLIGLFTLEFIEDGIPEICFCL